MLAGLLLTHIADGFQQSSFSPNAGSCVQGSLLAAISETAQEEA